MKITDHRIDGAAFEAANATGAEIKPELIVVHDTAGNLVKGNVVKYFASASCSVSAHFVVERDGSFTQMVPLNVQANHAGASVWNGRKNCNKYAIGVEIVNPGMMVRRGEKVVLVYREKRGERVVGSYALGECEEVNTPEHGHGWCLPYTPEQIETVKELCKAISAEYGIKEIVAHWHISPKRKVDTNPLFPMEEVREYALTSAEEVPAVRPDVDETPVAAAEPAKPGVLSNMTFAKVNELADQGSRVAGWIRSIKRWFWGGAATTGTLAASLDTRKGSANVFVELIREHPFMAMAVVAGIAGLIVYAVVKVVEKHLVTAANDGRYRPRGS